MENVTFVVACKKFFGFRPGMVLADFAAELKALTPADVADLKAEFPKVGYNVVENKN